MRKISLEEQKLLQMDILDAVDRFCNEHSINYSMACGTLLGAIRHGGYIPWDDDIDIYMLREDYNRFEAEFPEEYEGKYGFATLKRYDDWTLAFGKVYDNRTCCVEKRSKSKNPGINIDIFPIDDVPDSDAEWDTYNKQRRKNLLDLRHSGLTLSPINSLLKNIGAIVYGIRFYFTDRKKLTQKISDFAQIHNHKGYHRVFENTMGLAVKSPFRKSLFDEIIYIPFEERKYKAFKEYDEFLTSVFGDYMTPPPVEKRISFHTFDAYWKI